MFTGIVEEVGTVAALHRDRDGDRDRARLEVACTTVVADAAAGVSIAVDGCCLTVTEVSDDGFTADLMAETLRATALGDLGPDDPVNLERPLAAGGRLGGHLVQGHVDAVGQVVAVEAQPGTAIVTVAAPAEVAPYLVAKGSVTLSGVSLTVIDVTDHGEPPTTTFRVGLIPHTRTVTTLGRLAVGDRVNLEADVVAKYVARLLAAGTGTPYV